MKKLLLIAILGLLGGYSTCWANFFDVAQVSSTGMAAQRTRMDLIAENIANIDTVVTEEGHPYRRQYAILAQGNYNSSMTFEGKQLLRGVKVSKIFKDSTPFKKVYEPANPYADANGFVDIPNINTVKEMIDMIKVHKKVKVFEYEYQNNYK